MSVSRFNTGWLVAPNDHEEIARRLRSLLSTPGELERMGRLNEIPHMVVDADPADQGCWVAAARHAIEGLVGVS